MYHYYYVNNNQTLNPGLHHEVHTKEHAEQLGIRSAQYVGYFENEVENFETLKEAQDAMQTYFAKDKKIVEKFMGDKIETADDVTLFICDNCASACCDGICMEYQIYDFSNPIDGSKTAK